MRISMHIWPVKNPFENPYKPYFIHWASLFLLISCLHIHSWELTYLHTCLLAMVSPSEDSINIKVLKLRCCIRYPELTRWNCCHQSIICIFFIIWQVRSALTAGSFMWRPVFAHLRSKVSSANILIFCNFFCNFWRTDRQTDRPTDRQTDRQT